MTGIAATGRARSIVADVNSIVWCSAKKRWGSGRMQEN